ncbi:MAG: hypothetical protein E4H00_09665, partial [Myxococcales bacterium]
MIKVSCPSCNSSYDVDEHRLPADGLRMRCPKCSESFQVHPDGSTVKSGGGAAPGARKRPQRKPTQVGLGPRVPRPPGAAIHSPPSDLPAPAGEVDLPAPRSGGEFADLPAPFTGGALADLPAPRKGARSLEFDPFEDPGVADLPTPKAQPQSPSFDPFADMDLPAPFVGPSGSEVDLPAPMGAASARGIDPMAEEIDLPMALTDADLPRPRAASAVPAPISLDSDLPMPSDYKDLPVARDDFQDLEEFDGPQRIHGGGPIELDLPDGEDLDLEMELDAPVKPPVGPPAPPPPLGRALGSPKADRISRDSAELDLPASDGLEFSELPGA